MWNDRCETQQLRGNVEKNRSKLRTAFTSDDAERNLGRGDDFCAFSGARMLEILAVRFEGWAKRLIH